MDLDILQEERYMSPTLRELLKMRNREFGEDDSFFIRTFPYETRIAMFNNYEACTFARGFVPSIHHKLLNSKIVKRIHKKLIAKIASNVNIEGEKDADVTKIKNQISSFPSKVKECVSYMLSRGESCLTINSDGEKKILIEVYPLARYDLKKDSHGNIEEAFLYKQLFDGANKYLKYILVEHRYKKQEKYYIEYKVIEYTFRTFTDSEDLEKREIDPDHLPTLIKESIDDIELNKPTEISCLGVYRVKNTEVNELSPHSDIGESQYLDVLDEVISLDTSYTYRDVDKNIGRGRMMVPSLGMATTPQAFNINKDKSITRLDYKARHTILDNTFLQPYPDMSGDVSKAIPQAVQFNLRTSEWVADRQDYIASICTGCGLSVFDYDPTTSTGARTAREIDELSDLTASTVEEKRSALTETLNAMLKDIVALLGYGEETSVFVKWDKSTTVNKDANNEMVLSRYGAGLCSRKTAIKNLNPNWNEKEVDAEIDRIENETDSRDAAKEFEVM